MQGGDGVCFGKIDQLGALLSRLRRRFEHFLQEWIGDNSAGHGFVVAFVVSQMVGGSGWFESTIPGTCKYLPKAIKLTCILHPTPYSSYFYLFQRYFSFPFMITLIAI